MKKFEYTPPEQPRELILKLGQKITDRIGHTVTAEDPEYYGLEALVTDEMADWICLRHSTNMQEMRCFSFGQLPIAV